VSVDTATQRPAARQGDTPRGSEETARIAEQDLFQPFRQLGTQRTRHGEGHGLGLAIVRAIADAHGASLTAHARPGGGLDIEVTFPMASAAQRANAPDVTAQLTKVPHIQHANPVA